MELLVHGLTNHLNPNSTLFPLLTFQYEIVDYYLRNHEKIYAKLFFILPFSYLNFFRHIYKMFKIYSQKLITNFTPLHFFSINPTNTMSSFLILSYFF